MAARTAQARCSSAELRIQLYTDDPAIVAVGERQLGRQLLDVVLAWWLSLGFRLAWRKGTYQFTETPLHHQPQLVHDWVGIRYCTRGSVSVMSLTPEFLNSTRLALRPFLRRHGQAKIASVRSAVGKCSRISQVVPTAKPFSSSMWAALTGALQAQEAGREEAALGYVPVSRFFVAAAWFDALIEGDLPYGRWPLEREVSRQPVHLARAPADAHVEFDASPWGGGGLLRLQGHIVQHFTVRWDDEVLGILGARAGDSRWQTVYEYVTLLVALLLWGDSGAEKLLYVYGDNVGALQCAQDLKGRGPMLLISRELAWRRVRHRWEFELAHLPAELNGDADALSRVHAEPPTPLPPSVQKRGVIERQVPPWSCVFTAWLRSLRRRHGMKA